MVVKGKTKSGIKFQMDDRIRGDARFLYYLTKAQSEEDMAKQSAIIIDLLKLIFGTDEGVITFMDAVAGKHGGVCEVPAMLTELNDIFEALNAKNSSSSPES